MLYKLYYEFINIALSLSTKNYLTRFTTCFFILLPYHYFFHIKLDNFSSSLFKERFISGKLVVFDSQLLKYNFA